MKKLALLFSLLVILTTACTQVDPQVGTVSAVLTETAAGGSQAYPSTLADAPSIVFTPTQDFPPAETMTTTADFTPSDTLTLIPTATPTATSTLLFTRTPIGSPTFDFPKVTVNKAHAACMDGPNVEYLWGIDLKAGETGLVWGRSPYNNWLYIKMPDPAIPCWVSPSVVDVTGDPKRVTVQAINLWITNKLYAPPTGVKATRDGDQVTVSWNRVWMTVDDDRGYFLDVWVCQNGAYVWMPLGRLSLPDQYHTSYTLTDQPGCSQPSGGKLYTVEKHGYTSPVTVPWPVYGDAPTATITAPTDVPPTSVPPTSVPPTSVPPTSVPTDTTPTS